MPKRNKSAAYGAAAIFSSLACGQWAVSPHRLQWISSTTARGGGALSLSIPFPSPHLLLINNNLGGWSKNVNHCCLGSGQLGSTHTAWEDREESKLRRYLLKVLKLQVGSLYWWALVVWGRGGGGRTETVLLIAHGALANTVSPWEILDHPLGVVCSRR